jgi:hypothetical protein
MGILLLILLDQLLLIYIRTYILIPFTKRILLQRQTIKGILQIATQCGRWQIEKVALNNCSKVIHV